MQRKIAIALPCLGDEERQELDGPLSSGWLTQGPKVAAFERAFAHRHQVPHAIAASSCTTALHLILAALDIGPGDEVIVPAFTWVATANVVLYCGATPVLADIDPVTFNLDPAEVKRCLTPRTKAIIVVHLFGRCADMAGIAAAALGIPLIEDAACAAGAALNGVPAGGLGLAAAFSFHPRKTITTGEGGMVTTKDSALAEKISCLRNHGASLSEEERHNGPQPYLLPEFNFLGYNYRMTDLQGAVGLAQLAKLDRFIAERRQGAGLYAELLGDIGWLSLPELVKGHGWQAYVARIDPINAPLKRNQLMERLQAQGVATRPGTHGVHMLGLYQKRFGFTAGDFPAARDADAYSIALPLHNKMSKEDYRYVATALREAASCAD
jgi:perosamine synthetase